MLCRYHTIPTITPYHTLPNPKILCYGTIPMEVSSYGWLYGWRVHNTSAAIILARYFLWQIATPSAVGR